MREWLKKKIMSEIDELNVAEEPEELKEEVKEEVPPDVIETYKRLLNTVKESNDEILRKTLSRKARDIAIEFYEESNDKASGNMLLGMYLDLIAHSESMAISHYALAAKGGIEEARRAIEYCEKMAQGGDADIALSLAEGYLAIGDDKGREYMLSAYKMGYPAARSGMRILDNSNVMYIEGLRDIRPTDSFLFNLRLHESLTVDYSNLRHDESNCLENFLSGYAATRSCNLHLCKDKKALLSHSYRERIMKKRKGPPNGEVKIKINNMIDLYSSTEAFLKGQRVKIEGSFSNNPELFAYLVGISAAVGSSYPKEEGGYFVVIPSLVEFIA